jgi:hypothetical protein
MCKEIELSFLRHSGESRNPSGGSARIVAGRIASAAAPAGFRLSPE